MTTTSTLIRIGNSTGVIIPSRILKSLSLSVRDRIQFSEKNGEVTLRKLLEDEIETPFSALDAWCDDNGYADGGGSG